MTATLIFSECSLFLSNILYVHKWFHPFSYKYKTITRWKCILGITYSYDVNILIWVKVNRLIVILWAVIHKKCSSNVCLIDLAYFKTYICTNGSFFWEEKKAIYKNASKHKIFSSNEPWKFKLVVKKECWLMFVSDRIKIFMRWIFYPFIPDKTYSNNVQFFQ